jgi:hypothetical protein
LVVEIEGAGGVAVVTGIKIPTIDSLGTIIRCESDAGSKIIPREECLVCVDDKGLSRGINPLKLD